MRFKQKLLQSIKKRNITKQKGFKKWYEAEDLTKMSKRLAQEKLRDLLKKKGSLLNTFRVGSGKKILLKDSNRQWGVAASVTD